MPYYLTLPAFGGFASFGMLGWAALASVPIIIHLLHRRRYRETTWAAMRFLLAATRKHSRRIRLEQFLLLAVRTLILLLLVLALARPYVESLAGMFRADAPVHRIVVLDTSLSMAWRAGEQSRLEQARQLAREAVSSTRPGDALNLVRVGSLPPTAIVRRPSHQESQVLREVDALPQTDEFGEVTASLREVESLLVEVPQVTAKEVVIVSDFQRSNWHPDGAGEQAQIQRALRRIGEKGRLVLVNVGGPKSPNRAVTGLIVTDPFAIVGRPVHLRAAVQSDGAAAAESQLELRVDGRLVSSQRVALTDGEAAAVDFEYTFSESGEHRLEARLADDDPLARDDRRVLALPVREKLQVLLVNGRPAGRAREEATFFAEQVLRPGSAGADWQGVTEPTVIRDGELESVDLDRYDCVFLCDVALVTEQEAALLRSYVEGGGGLVIALGDRVRTADYNRVLYDDGKGLLPVRLGEVRGQPIGDDPGQDQAEDLDRFFRFDPADLKHPIVHPYAGNPGTGLEETLISRYVRVQVPEGNAVQRVINYTNGDPAILDAPVGRGRVILITTALDDRWGLWPILPQTSFPPIIQETVRHVVAGRWVDRNVQVGQPITGAFRRADVAVTARLPDGGSESLKLAESDGLGTLRFTDTAQAGVYEFRLGQPIGRTELYGVNPDPRESRLAGLSESDIGGLLPGGEYQYRTDWQAPPREPQESAGDGTGLVRWLLTAVLCLVFIEQLMAWRFRWGLAALGLVIAAALVRQAFFASLFIGAAAGLGVAALLIAVAVLWSRRTRGAGVTT
jgi:hypothetical protein